MNIYIICCVSIIYAVSTRFRLPRLIGARVKIARLGSPYIHTRSSFSRFARSSLLNGERQGEMRRRIHESDPRCPSTGWIPRWIAPGIGNTLRPPRRGNRGFSLEISGTFRGLKIPARDTRVRLFFSTNRKRSVRLAKLNNSDTQRRICSRTHSSTIPIMFPSRNTRLPKISRSAAILM